MESSHPGSDDAVPPLFSAEVLGSRDQQVSQAVARGVGLRHSEGVYSRRLREAGRGTQDAHTGSSELVNRGSQRSERRPPPSSAHRAEAWPSTRPGPSPHPRPSPDPRPSPGPRPPAEPMRERGPSSPGPPTPPSLIQGDEDGEEDDFQPLRGEMDTSHALRARSPLPLTAPEPRLPGPAPQRAGTGPAPLDPGPAPPRALSTLDQLWRRFSARWSREEEEEEQEARPAGEREASLLERLERLSRLLHSGAGAELTGPDKPRPHSGPDKPRLHSGPDKPAAQEPDPAEHEPGERRRRKEEEEAEGRREAWPQQEEEEESGGSGPPPRGASLSRHLCPAERDESGETSSGASTVDTARLVRAFGAQRVRGGLRTGGAGGRGLEGRGLERIHSAVSKQQRRGGRGRGQEDTPPPTAPSSEVTGTDESVVTADSASSASTYTSRHANQAPHTGRQTTQAQGHAPHTSRHAPSGPHTQGHAPHTNGHAPPAKKPVKLVNKSIQTGDLEIVSNGTRRHTRDVGTTFPSPGGSRLPSPSSSSSSSANGARGVGVERGVAMERGAPVFLRERKSKDKRSQTEQNYPEGVSWFVAADDLRARAESRKENRPETAPGPQPKPAPGPTVWFHPYSRTRPWREPLRPRQDQQDWTRTTRTDQQDRTRTTRTTVLTKPGPGPGGKPPSALVRLSLQEALQLRRPQFVSRSRERLKRLALKTEDRKLQAVFSRERDELFNRPGGAGRLPKPAGTALVKRAVPQKEMVQRTKQMFSQLPEVQKRREEERRKVEYRSYRLNAQLYNKIITNRVLGKRTAWQ